MRVLWRLLQFVKPYWWATALSLGLIFALSSLRLGPAWFLRRIIDEAIPAADHTLLLWALAGLVGSAALANGLAALQGYLEQWVGQRVVFDLRNVLYRHLQSQSMSFYDANQTGQLMSRVTNDVSQVQFFLTQGITRLINTVVTLALSISVLFALDVTLSLVALSVVPLIWWLQRHLSQVAPLFRAVQQRMADLNVVIQENVAGIKLIQTYGREPYEARRFEEVNRDIRLKRLEIGRLLGFIMPGQEFATNISLTLILIVGALRVMRGDLSLGTLVAFQSYAMMMWMPVRWIGMVTQMAQQAMAAGERIFEILDTPLEVQEKPDAIVLPPLRGEIVFENVSFAYRKERPLLRNISFTVRPGETVALVGPSGSGKSTIVNLIPRFYDVTEGRVLIDGYDVREVSLASLRSQIGMVLQETFLFNTTVKENIRYGRADATDEEVIEAAKAACAHEFIMQLPQGYDTVIGERGVRLSGGQRQRIAIARALLVNPRILILDEATSSVDTRTDYLIQQALDRLMRGRTTVVIAHRLSTVQRADQILVLQDGQIIARGTHQELLRTCPLYQYLYEVQFRLQRDGAVSGERSPTLVTPNGRPGTDGVGGAEWTVAHAAGRLVERTRSEG